MYNLECRIENEKEIDHGIHEKDEKHGKSALLCVILSIVEGQSTVSTFRQSSMWHY